MKPLRRYLGHLPDSSPDSSTPRPDTRTHSFRSVRSVRLSGPGIVSASKATPNLLDRIVGWIAPAWGARRLEARRVLARETGR